MKKAYMLLLLGLPLLAACEEDEPIDWDNFECDIAPIEIPAELGIVNDDAQWLCGRNRPGQPRSYDDWGVVAAGVRACFGGEGGAIEGDDIWVAVDGDDSAAGTSADAPLATLAAALCKAAPGQTIHVAPGTYDQDGALLGAFGSASSAELVIRGEGAEPTEVVFDGGRWRSFAVGLTESYHVRVENLTIQHYTDTAIYTLLGSHITVRDVVSRSNGRCNVDPDAEGEGFGVNLVGTRDVVVEGSVFEDNGPLYEALACGAMLGTGINTFEASGTMRDNEFRHSRGGAMLVEDGGPFSVTGNTAEQNFYLALDNYWDAAIWIDGSVDVEVRDNTFLDGWGGVGVMVTDEEGVYPGASTRTVITGNQISGHLAGVLVWGYGACPPPEDAIQGYDELETTNALDGNSFQGEATPVLCDPQFFGGELP